jgi:hypothetical protein
MWSPSSEWKTDYQSKECQIPEQCNVDNPSAKTTNCSHIQGGSNMTGTNCDLFIHNQSRSYSNHLVSCYIQKSAKVMVKWPTAK